MYNTYSTQFDCWDYFDSPDVWYEWHADAMRDREFMWSSKLLNHLFRKAQRASLSYCITVRHHVCATGL